MRIASVEAIPAGSCLLRAGRRRRRHLRRRRVDVLRLADRRGRDRRGRSALTSAAATRSTWSTTGSRSTGPCSFRGMAVTGGHQRRRPGAVGPQGQALRGARLAAPGRPGPPGGPGDEGASSTGIDRASSSRPHASAVEDEGYGALKILLFQDEHHADAPGGPDRGPRGPFRGGPRDRGMAHRPRRRAAPQHDRRRRRAACAVSWPACGPLFVEDPIPPDSVAALRAFAAKVAVPVAAGERNTTIWEFAEYLERPGVAYVRPDVGIAGGITHVKKICALAESFHAGVLPHAVPSGPVSRSPPTSSSACASRTGSSKSTCPRTARVDRRRGPRDRGARRLPARARTAPASASTSTTPASPGTRRCRSTSPRTPLREDGSVAIR